MKNNNKNKTNTHKKTLATQAREIQIRSPKPAQMPSGPGGWLIILATSGPQNNQAGKIKSIGKH